MGIVSLHLNIINIFHVVLSKSILINFFAQKPCRTKLDHMYQPEMLCLYLSSSSNHTRVHRLRQSEALLVVR